MVARGGADGAGKLGRSESVADFLADIGHTVSKKSENIGNNQHLSWDFW